MPSKAKTDVGYGQFCKTASFIDCSRGLSIIGRLNSGQANESREFLKMSDGVGVRAKQLRDVESGLWSWSREVAGDDQTRQQTSFESRSHLSIATLNRSRPVFLSGLC